jgi:hypothetical protein
MTDLNIVSELSKVAPPIAVTSFSVMGHPLPEVIQVVTLVYLVLQIVLVIPKVATMIGARYGKGRSTGK